MKSQIKKIDIFCSGFQFVPPANTKIKEVLEQLDQAAILQHGNVDKGALNNSRGDWFEWIIGIIGLKVSISNNTQYIPIILPNSKQLNIEKLYVQSIQDICVDYKNSFNSHNLFLSCSNPDFVLVSKKLIQNIPNLDIITPQTIVALDSLYKQILGCCSLDDIKGYLSVKTSFRSDRRYQVIHEGSIVKAVHQNLAEKVQQTIFPLKYYTITTRLSKSDKIVMNTVAPHSIHNNPIPAVDGIYETQVLGQIENVFLNIL